MTNLTEYTETQTFYNGVPIKNQNIMIEYNGDNLYIINNNNGDISYTSLDNQDIFDILNKEKSEINLNNRFKNILRKNKKRCPNGTRKNKYTGNCEKKKNKKCPKGTRRNKYTKKCEPKYYMV
jgi:hypothetical protein